MMPTAYYNEHEPSAAAWLRELIKVGLIAAGEVDERDIQDVLPKELVRYTQCHFFAGIGVWSYALRRAGWPDSRPVWTGSCPCQPFSAAGKGAGFADERHLWPAFFHLISVNRPDVVFGEQVASKDGFAWLDIVQADLEAEAYAVGAVSIPACGFGAPHKRERLFFVADAESDNKRRQRECREGIRRGQLPIGGYGAISDVANTQNERHEWNGSTRRRRDGLADNGNARVVANANGRNASAEGIQRGGQQRQFAQDGRATNGFWENAEWIYCQDDKHRPVEPGSFPLAHGASARLGRLRGYGNAIVAPVAEGFIRAYLETKSGLEMTA